MGGASGWWRSTNGGVSWVNATPPTTNIGCLLRLANGDVVVLNEFSTRVYRSSDQGLTWSELNAAPAGCQTVAINDSGVVLLSGSTPANFYTTTDFINWTQVTKPSASASTVVAVGSAFYAGGLSAGIYTSSNNGASWSLAYPTNTLGGHATSDSNGAIVTFNSTVLKSPSSSVTYSSTGESIVLDGYFGELRLVYSLKTGSVNNHNSSNYYTVSVNLVRYADNVTTEYVVSLNNPYPTSTNSNTEVIPINLQSFGGYYFKVNYVTAIGLPSPINVTVYLGGRRIHV
jgi:hypothetical protein